MALALTLAGCGRGDGAIKVAFIDSSENLFAGGTRLSSGGQHVRAATRAGLVALDENGEVVPALADRWIVTDDGLSFIFRLRDGKWPDGRDLTAQSVKTALDQAIRAMEGTALGLELGAIGRVRAMAGRVIEIRLVQPVPSFLQLLAQPELGLSRGRASATGPMTLEHRGDMALLTMKPPAERGLPEEPDWQRFVRPLELRALTPERAIRLFEDGEVDVVLGGRIGALPLAPSGPLSRGTVQLDPALGLFGLHVRRARGFLAEAANREALSMALDRGALLAPFNIGGWRGTTRLVPPGVPGPGTAFPERWEGVALEQLRSQAARRVAGWRAGNANDRVELTLAIGDGPGDRMLLRELAAQLGAIGIVLRPVAENAPADLALVDRVARYAEPRWFLDQFNCRFARGLCSEVADALVRDMAREPDAAVRSQLLTQAEDALAEANVFIPFGAPVRFSLVRSDVTGFAPNAWVFHPLPALAEVPR